MKRGSVTVFLALVLVLVLSFVFSLLEGARFCCLQNRARTVTDICMQSLFGNYHAGVWEDYHLLFLDGSWQEGEFSIDKSARKMMEELSRNLSGGSNMMGEKGWEFVEMTAADMEITQFQLASDNEGKVFQSQVSRQMKLEAAESVLEELFQVKELGQEAEKETQGKEDKWNQAWEALEEAEEIQEENVSQEEEGQQAESEQEETAAESEIENPMDYVKELKHSTMLTLVLEDTSQLSTKALQDTDGMETRQLQSGNWNEAAETGILDRMWLQYFIQKHYSNYTAESESGPAQRMLDYEMEYLIGGKDSDSENLETVVYELLALREAMNFITIMGDTEKKELALGIATAAVGFTGILPLIKAVQIGILLAWSFVESIMDIRTLLKGEKIPFLKRPEQWSGNLENCRSSVEGNGSSEADSTGLTYTQYLQILLFLLSQKTINYRCMDVIEQNEQVKMDGMLQAVEGSGVYKAKPLFWNLSFLRGNGWEEFTISAPAAMTYVP